MINFIEGTYEKEKYNFIRSQFILGQKNANHINTFFKWLSIEILIIDVTISWYIRFFFVK
jgi:hypothetical protein